MEEEIERNILTPSELEQFQIEADLISLTINNTIDPIPRPNISSSSDIREEPLSQEEIIQREIQEAQELINNIEEDQEDNNDFIEQNLTDNIDLVLGRDGEYIEFSEDLELIKHRNYYIYFDQVGFDEWNNRDDDEERIIVAINEEGEQITVSDDWEHLINVEEEIYINKQAVLNQGYVFNLTLNKWEIPKPENIDINNLPFYEDMKNCLNSFYPNNWWLQSTNYTFDLLCENRKSYFLEHEFIKAPLSLIIKFPEFTITNSSNQSHIIKDLYILILLKANGSFLRAKICGFRSKITNIEKIKGYYHSHLPNSSEYTIGKFCLGTGPLVEITASLEKQFNTKTFDIFLATLTIYLEWESIEGSPHRHMKNILQEVPLDPNFSINEAKVESEINKLLSTNKLDFNLQLNENKKLDINYNSLEEKLTILLSSTFTNLVYKNEDTNTYFNLLNGINNQQSDYKKPLCTLGENKIYMEIENIENKNTGFKKVLHPKITEYAKKYLTWRINEFYNQEN